MKDPENGSFFYVGISLFSENVKTGIRETKSDICTDIIM
jgi:hypothetical protein